MKLMYKDEERLVFRLGASERETLLRLLGTRRHLPLKPRRLSNQSSPKTLQQAAEELHAASDRHQAEIFATLSSWLENPSQCVPEKVGHTFTLARGQLELMLQAINGIRIAAWEKMGSPDMEETFPEPTPINEACVAIIQVADRLLAQLLQSLETPEGSS